MATAIAVADLKTALPVATPVEPAPIQDSASDLATQFEADGFCVAPGVADASQLEACRAAALEALDDCKARDPTMGVGQKSGYKEIVQRMPGRYEMRYGLDREPLLNLRRRVEKSLAFEAARRIL